MLSPEEEKHVHELILNIRDMDPGKVKEQIPSPAIAIAFLERLPADLPEMTGIINAIKETYGQREVLKAIKKTLFKLRKRGVTIPDPVLAGETPFQIKTTGIPDPSAYLGPVDGMGNRAVFLAIPQIPKGVDVGLGIVSDEEGILNYIFGRYSKKRMNEVKAIFFEQTGLMLQTALPHAAGVLEKAYHRNPSSIDESAQGYLQLRPWILENITPLEQPQIYNDIPPDDISTDILTDSQITKLFEHELMVSWIIGPEDIKPIIEKIKDVEESQILVSEDQKMSRIKDIEEKGVEELFPEEKRAIIKNRLEEMAFVFHETAQGDFTKLSLAAAKSLDDRDSILGVNVFLKAMIKRSLDLYGQLEGAAGANDLSEEETDSEPTIIVP